MQNAITTLRIRNFKSIKDVTLKPRRVNLIIGEPNVGKSNVLEAMSLLGGIGHEHQGRFLEGVLRYQVLADLFYQTTLSNTIRIDTDSDIAFIGKDLFSNSIRYLALPQAYFEDLNNEQEYQRLKQTPFGDADAAFIRFFEEFVLNSETERKQFAPYNFLELKEDGINIPYDPIFHFSSPTFSASAVRFYRYSAPIIYSRSLSAPYLLPPKGSNLLALIRSHQTLSETISRLLSHTQQRLVIREKDLQLEVGQELNGVLYTYPFSSIADTLQRLIFYLAAIESNDDAVLLFEEPEAHSYPVYVAQLGRRIAESRNNQFFVATHSPYLITEILETMLPDEAQAQEVAIFVAYYEDYQTKLRQLTDAEVRGIRADGLDVFYNMDRLVHPDA